MPVCNFLLLFDWFSGWMCPVVWTLVLVSIFQAYGVNSIPVICWLCLYLLLRAIFVSAGSLYIIYLSVKSVTVLSQFVIRSMFYILCCTSLQFLLFFKCCGLHVSILPGNCISDMFISFLFSTGYVYWLIMLSKSFFLCVLFAKCNISSNI